MSEVRLITLFLTETVTGIETLKSSAVEPRLQSKWERFLAGYAKANFRSSVLGTVGSQGVQLISKLVTILLLFFGAKEVMAGRLTLGELVAFNMLSGQVAQPILRLSQLWPGLSAVPDFCGKVGRLVEYPDGTPANLEPIAHTHTERSD